MKKLFDRRRVFSDNDRTLIHKMYKQGKTKTEIARYFNKNLSSIQHVLTPKPNPWRYPKGHKRTPKYHRKGIVQRIPTQKDFILKDTYDRRRKLTDSDIKRVKQLYATGKYTLLGLSQKMSVSRTTIKYIVHPSYSEMQKRRSREYSKSHRPNKKHAAKVQAEHRTYKRSLIKSFFKKLFK